MKISKSSLTPRALLPCPPTQNLFPPANLNSHHEKTLRGQKSIQLLLASILLSQAKKHRSRPLSQPGFLHFVRNKIITPYNTRLLPAHCQGREEMGCQHGISMPWDVAFPPQNHDFFSQLRPKSSRKRVWHNTGLQDVCGSFPNPVGIAALHFGTV